MASEIEFLKKKGILDWDPYVDIETNSQSSENDY